MRNTVWAVYFGDSRHAPRVRGARRVDPLWDRYIKLMTHMTWDDDTGALAGDTTTEEGLIAAMERWHARVKCAPCPPTGCSSGTRAKATSRCASSSRSRCPPNRCRG